jgi:drug/metabolite transporter (DMT)-like permease
VRSASMVRVYGALVSAMVIWGLSFLAIKDAIGTIPIFSLLFARFLLATLLLGIVGIARRALRLPARDIAVLAGLSLLSPIGYFIFETFGVANTEPSHVSVIIATIPIAVYLIAFARRQERVTWRRTAGILVAYSGILVIVAWGRHDAGASLLGDLLVLGAVVCAATRTTLIKETLRRVTPLQLTFYQFAFSLVVFGPLALTEGAGWMSQMTPRSYLEVLFLGVFCSAGAFLFMHYALVHLSATQVAVSANLVPVITLTAEIAILGSPVTLPKVLGTAITLIGVLWTQLDRSAHLPPRTDYESAVLKTDQRL